MCWPAPLVLSRLKGDEEKLLGELLSSVLFHGEDQKCCGVFGLDEVVAVSICLQDVDWVPRETLGIFGEYAFVLRQGGVGFGDEVVSTVKVSHYILR